jgi:hypothetical protein
MTLSDGCRGSSIGPESAEGRRLLACLERGGDAEALGHTVAVIRVGFPEMLDLPSLDITRHARHVGDDIGNEPSALRHRHQAEQIAGLRIVVIPLMVIVAVCIAGDRERRLEKSHIPSDLVVD